MMEKYNINQTTLKILGLYLGDYKRSLHLRGIARETDVDVKAVQLQLRKLEKSGILLSTVRGRNKEHFLNLGNPLTRYYMILAEAFASITYLGNNFLIKKVVDELADQVDGTIILFGSFAKSQETRESDIDLFILTEQKSNAYLRTVREVEDLVGREINVKSTDRISFLKGLEEGDPLTREVISVHIVLKGFDDFCNIMWDFYAKP
jgi:predicted nucleotidyltransferase